jgi:hypothetical protein
LLGLRWVEFVNTRDQARVIKWLVSRDYSLGIEFGAMNPFDGLPVRCFYRKIPCSGNWLVLIELLPLPTKPPQNEFDFSPLADADDGIEENDTYEGGGGGGGILT